MKKDEIASEKAEFERVASTSINREWKLWGPYLAERQWATVREDYSANGDTWNHVSHESARSNAYRWGEDGIGGFCDYRQIMCLAPAFWNGKDDILKERLFGLTNGQGNHGEDVKELYYHLDSSPTHSYCKYLYKYPQAKFPYEELIIKNRRSKTETEYELADTGIFDNGQYFDCFIEYAKDSPDDILMKITVHNRGPETADIHVIPHLWFRNYWKHNPRYTRPKIKLIDTNCLETKSIRNGRYYYYFEGGTPLFCDNETNNSKIYNSANDSDYVKDGINDHIVNSKNSVNLDLKGSKAAIWYNTTIDSGQSKTFKIRLTKKKKSNAWKDFDLVFDKRKAETEKFYKSIIPDHISDDKKHIVKSAFGGLLWTKQFYYLDMHKWHNGGPGEQKPHRVHKRNLEWRHMTHRHIISMPDKWEYPWYAAWDLAFHAKTFSLIDVEFAKHQLLLMLREYYMHPNGQIPAYEWNFSDVNPPVHSWAVWEVFENDKLKTGIPDYDFLEKCFQKLLINFTWWVNQKDKDGSALFDGGFLGLDNIGVFDRNQMPPGISRMQQADATSWMAMFALNMLRMSLELAIKNPAYEESAAKFFRHFLNIAWAMHHIGERDISLWDEEDNFYYDVVQMASGHTARMKVRSLVGIIPLFAVEVINKGLFDSLTEFKERAQRIIRTRPDLASLISRIEEGSGNGDYLFSLIRGYRLEHILKRLLDENEFLSEYGIRSLSKYHEKNPFVFSHFGEHSIHYEPGESSTDMFGGNSNWRGPIWFPINYMIIQSLRKFYKYYGPEYVYEFPTGSDNKLNLKEIAKELTLRLMRIFEKDDKGKYQYHNNNEGKLFSEDPHTKDLHLFYEFFHGETGRGMGASHQTGWTALIANLLIEIESVD